MLTRFYTLALMGAAGLVASAYNANKSDNNLPKAFKDLKAVTYIPGNTNMPAFYMFKNEVSVLGYQEFLYHVKLKGDKELLANITPDSTLWKQMDGHGGESMVRLYSRMHFYPVVNISRSAAMEYCKWLSDFWNAKQTEYTVEFRLPTPVEWEYAALGGGQGPYPWGGPYCRNSKGLYLAQFKTFGLNYGPAKTGSFEPNGYGLYNMSGNVAEITSDFRITKGGSWDSHDSEITVSALGKYIQAPTVGFRPVMTFIKR